MFSSNKISFILTAIIVLCAITSGDTEIALGNGNYTWLLTVVATFFVVFYDYVKLLHSETSKKDYFIGSLVSHGIFPVLIWLVNTGIYLLVDLMNKTQTVVICIFTPIAPLRQVLAGFFRAIMLNSNVLLHIAVCLLLWAVLSLGDLAVLKRKCCKQER